MARSGVANLDSLQRVAPGLKISAIGSGWVSYTYLRGAGTNQSDAGSDPSVAYFSDEVYLGEKAGLQFDLLDVDHIEVLKGPQGTLFGRNAAAGAISVTTRRPSVLPTADFSGELGNYNAFLARGTVSGPLSGDNLLYRLSFGTRQRSAFTENLSGGKDPGDLHSYAGRAQVEWKGDKGMFLVSADVLQARNGMTNQFLASNFKGATLSAAAVATLPSGESFYKHYYDVPGYERQDMWSVTGRGEWETPVGNLTSITAYRWNQFNRLQDQDGTIKSAFALGSAEKTAAFSQELRLANDPSNRLKWIVGLYYYNAKVDSLFNVFTGPDFATPSLQNVTRLDQFSLATRSYAAFGQASFDITKELTLTAGGRYTVDDKDDLRTVTPGVGYPVHPSGRWSSFDPAVTLDYKLSRDVMFYASFRQGFKSGGFQSLLPASSVVASTTFLPEHVKSYEGGVKSTLLDRKLVFNLSIFRADITNQQISRTISATQAFIDNAGVTQTNGVDVSFNARPTSALRFTADFTYQRARFVKFISGASNFAGETQLRSPDFTGVWSAEYDFEVGAGTLTPRVEYYYTSDIFYDNANTKLPGIYQPGYGLANASLTFHPSHGDWQASLWGRNLGNTHYYRNIQISPGPQGLVVPGDPLTVGGSFELHFR